MGQPSDAVEIPNVFLLGGNPDCNRGKNGAGNVFFGPASAVDGINGDGLCLRGVVQALDHFPGDHLLPKPVAVIQKRGMLVRNLAGQLFRRLNQGAG